MVGILSQHTCIANHQGILSISYNFISQLYLSRARKHSFKKKSPEFTNKPKGT